MYSDFAPYIKGGVPLYCNKVIVMLTLHEMLKF